MDTNNSGSSADRPSASPGGAGVSGGNPAPSGPSLVATCIAGVKNAFDAVKALLGRPLTKDERKHVPRVRRLVEQYVGRVIGLLADFPTLAPQGRTPQELIEKQALFDALGPLLNVLVGFHTEVKDTMMELEADLYTTALSICTIAEQSKAPDQTVMQVVGEMRKALAHGPA